MLPLAGLAGFSFEMYHKTQSIKLKYMFLCIKVLQKRPPNLTEGISSVEIKEKPLNSI